MKLLPYFYIFFSGAGISSFAVIDVVYFQDAGWSLAFIGTMIAAFNISVSIAELPFAVVFDRYSNKISVQIGNLVRICAFVLFFLNWNATSLIIANVLAGIASAAASGTSDALIINQIKDQTSENIILGVGKMTFCGAAASLLGGSLGIIGYKYYSQSIWILAIVFFALSFITITFFHEKEERKNILPWKKYLLKCFKVIKKPEFLFSTLTNACTIAPFMLWQIKFHSFSLSFVFIGFFLMNGVSLLIPPIMNKWLKKIRLDLLLIFNIFALLLFAVSAEPVFIALSFALHIGAHLMLSMLMGGNFQACVENDIRVTMSSSASLVDSFLVMLLAPFIGWLGQEFGLTAGVSVSAGIYFVLFILVISMKRFIHVA